MTICNAYAALSRAELKYERMRLAQKALLQIEEEANRRREKEQREKNELEIMQQELQNLLASEATMVTSPFHYVPHFPYEEHHSQL